MYPNYMNKPSFMTNTANTTFGASTSSFGQPAANTPMFSSIQPTNMFQTPSTSSFNAGPSSQTTFGSNLFGQQQQPSTSGLFGSTNTFGQNKATFGFGSTTGQTGLFGQPPAQQAGTSLFQPNTSNLFGSTNAFGTQGHTGTVIKFSPVTGTDTMQKNGVTQSISTKHHCITCMKEYENKSLEELRFEDYSCNRKGPQQQAGFSSAPFGSNTGATSTSLFGQTDNKQGFGQTTGFGQNSTFGQSTPGFGATNPTNTPSLFGKPTFGATTTASTFGFGTTPTPSNPFSANHAPKPFPQPLFGTTTTQPQTGFGTGVFGQTNTQNTTSNLFQKPAQPTTGFNTGQTGFSFNQTTQASNLFNVSKPNTGFGIFGQPNTATSSFGQTSQPTFGTNFGKLTTTSFAQPIQPTFGSNLGGGMQQPSLFTNTAAKPTNLFGTATTGSNLFNNNVFQQTPNSFSLNMNQQQPVQFPPEQSDDSKNISVIATDTFPDGPHVYGLEPLMGDTHHSTTNPQDIKAMLDYSKKKEDSVGSRTKIKVHLAKPKRGANFTKDFFDTNLLLKNSPKTLFIRKFNDGSSTIYNKYDNELIEEAAEYTEGLDSKGDTETSTVKSLTMESARSEETDDSAKPENQARNVEIRLQMDRAAYSDATSDDTRSNRSFTFEGGAPTFSPPSFVPPLASSTEMLLSDSETNLHSGIGLTDEDAIVAENRPSPPPTGGSSGDATNTDNPAGVILTKPEYYMYPALKDLAQYMDENGECVVQGLTIGRRGYGNVYFPDPIDISNMNLDEIVHFRHREVVIYPDDNKKPPVGEGLNRRAQVTLEKIYPREKGTNKYITDVNQIIQSNFVDNLMHVTQKHNCKFVDYRPKTGSWVFKVKHFSKYSFTESDEEECEVSNEKQALKKSEALKKVHELDEMPNIGLGGQIPMSISERSILEAESGINSSHRIFEYWPEEVHLMISEDMYRTKSAIQTIKASLFSDMGKAVLVPKMEKEIINIPEIPSEVLSAPRVVKIPDMSLLALCEKVSQTQRCYTDFGVFRNNTYKVGWGKGFRFYNFNKTVDVNIVHALTEYSMQVEPEGHYTAMMPNLTDMLQITLEESEFTFDVDKIPTITIKKDLSYLKKQTALFNKHATEKGLHGKNTYLSSVWNLCTALWDGGNRPCERREKLSDWLKTAAYQLADDWIIRENPNMSESETFKAIFKLLSFHKIKEASEFAAKHNLNQLSTLISQLSANERFKFWMRKCLETFAWKEQDIVLDDFRKVYMLLAGVAVDQPVNVCENLDWRRAFGIHLWYGAPAACPIYVAFDLYKKAFEERQYATKPIPPYCSSELEATDYDLLYHILAVYCDCTYQLCRVLHPETHTDQVMDYRFSWFLLQLFLSLQAGLITEAEKDHMHTTFATQLENTGHWKWAIFALLYLNNNVYKKNAVMRILDRNLSSSFETFETERELVKVFKIPAAWIHEVKATKAKAVDCYYDYFQYSLYLENWHEVNDAFVTYVLPELFIHGQFDYLRKCLRKIEPCRKIFHNWNVTGGLFEDFMFLYDLLQEENEEAVRNIAGQLSYLFRRIKCFPTNNDQQRLCVAELSRQCALLLNLVQEIVDSETFQTKFVEVLKNVVLPLDIKHNELNSTLSKYIKADQPEHTDGKEELAI